MVTGGIAMINGHVAYALTESIFSLEKQGRSSTKAKVFTDNLIDLSSPLQVRSQKVDTSLT